MNAYDAAAVLADIGAEVRKITAPLDCYDITLHLDDGEAIDLRVDKPVLDIDKRMRRLCRWLGALTKVQALSEERTS